MPPTVASTRIAASGTAAGGRVVRSQEWGGGPGSEGGRDGDSRAGAMLCVPAPWVESQAGPGRSLPLGVLGASPAPWRKGHTVAVSVLAIGCHVPCFLSRWCCLPRPASSFSRRWPT